MKRLVNRLSGACLYVLLALIVGMSSCEDDANDWTVNKNYDALFRPLTFDKSATDATSVTLRYSQIVNAKVYIFEFYTDSLEFNAENYVRTDTILKDTLTVFSESDIAYEDGISYFVSGVQRFYAIFCSYERRRCAGKGKHLCQCSI